MEKKSFTCKFCNKTLSSKGSLSNHIRKSKRCINNRKNKEGVLNYNCKDCNLNFSSKQSLSNHIKICKSKYTKYYEKIILEKDKLLEEQKEEYEKRLKEQKEEYEKRLKEQEEKDKEQIRELQDKLENIAIKAATKPTTQHTNYIQNNLQPLTNADFTKYLDKLTPKTLIIMLILILYI